MRLKHKRLPTAPTPCPDGSYVEVAGTGRGAGGAMLLALVNHAGLTREALADQLPGMKPGRPLTAAAVTSWIHGIRPLAIGRLADAARACGYQLRLVAVPVDAQGRALPTQGDADADTIAYLRTVLRRSAPADGEVPSALWVELRDAVDPVVDVRHGESAVA